MMETLAELPLTGDQVGLFKAQPGRPKDFVLNDQGERLRHPRYRKRYRDLNVWLPWWGLSIGRDPRDIVVTSRNFR
jgi:hypothetical protein